MQNEPIYYIIDYTDKDTIYFQTYEDVERYTSTFNHDMVVCRRTLSSWEVINYYERSTNK